MKNISITILIILVTFISFKSWSHKQIKRDTEAIELAIYIPQMSGGLVPYKIFKLKNDTLFEYYKPLLGTKNIIDTFPISKTEIIQLDLILSKTDSLGFHHLTTIHMGSPRFEIFIKHNSKSMEGFIANCYRKHIFDIIDWLNYNYPNGNIIEYNKEYLEKKQKEEDDDLKDFLNQNKHKPSNK